MNFVLRGPVALDRALVALDQVPLDGTMEVVIRKHNPRRDYEHDAAMQSRLRQLAEHCGYTYDELSKAVKRNLGLFYERDVLGERQRYLKSSKDYTNEECRLVMDYLEQIAAELGFRFEVGE